jgi:EAL domain-containing protein (putative c-di-GMP-specific phosphodiesterase class I)
MSADESPEGGVTVRELADALTRDELVFYYQPRISLVLGTICGAEALLRWVRPDGRVVPPGAFIPIAESTGFITDITIAMFPKLLADMALFHDIDHLLVTSFNASGRDFANDRFERAVWLAVERGLVRPGRLEIELTESAVLSGGHEIVKRLDFLRGQGVQIAMDDFGTGYSSMDTLSKLPFSALKIDQGVVGRMETSPKDATIVDSSIQLGHALGLEVVAEGVETEQAYLRLQSEGCTEAQGYWMSRPIPLDAYVEFLAAGHRWPAEPLGLIHMALLDHLAWRKALTNVVLLRPRSPAPPVAMDPRKCRLGQWYYGLGRSYAGRPSFDAVEPAHERLHALGAKLLDRATTGGAGSAEVLRLMRELSAESVNIMAALQELENDLLAQRTPSESARLRTGLSVRPPGGD